MRNWPGRLLILIIAAIITSCVSTAPIIRYNIPVQLPNLHKTIYVDHNLDPSQKKAVARALDDWECASNDMIHFDVKWDTSEEDELFLPDPRFYIIIKNVDSYDRDIVKSDAIMRQQGKTETTIGLYTRNDEGIPLILLVNDRLNDYLYLGTLEHELGHSLGLEHETDKNSIMYPNINEGPRMITKVDLKDFCKLYSCDADKLKVCRISE